MESISLTQLIAAIVMSSAFTTGLFSVLSKKLQSPEAKNDLTKLGNDFAHQLLTEARNEREQLRLTIKELSSTVVTKDETIDRLKHLLREKDQVIQDLELRQVRLAKKLREGTPITLKDVFGEVAPEGIMLTYETDTP